MSGLSVSDRLGDEVHLQSFRRVEPADLSRCRHGFDHGRRDAHLRHVAQDCSGRPLRIGDGVAAGQGGRKPVDAEHRTIDAVAGRAAGINQHTGAGTVGSRYPAGSVGLLEGILFLTEHDVFHYSEA